MFKAGKQKYIIHNLKNADLVNYYNSKIQINKHKFKKMLYIFMKFNVVLYYQNSTNMYKF